MQFNQGSHAKKPKTKATDMMRSICSKRCQTGEFDGTEYQETLPSLLSILNSNKLRSIPPDSVVNTSSIDLICKLLSSEDYVSVAEQLSLDSDVKNLLDFMLHLLCDGLLPNLDETMGIKRRARRLMFKIISRIPVIPSSLIVTGVSMPEKRDYIGSGGFGRVFKGELQGAVVALKVLYGSDNNVAFCREALMWRSLTHRSVLPFLGIYELEDGTAPQFFLVSPYMTNGNLAQWRKKTNPSVAEVEERMIEVAQGMEYIHSEGVVHGDLRGENILLDAEVHVQIADFGLTRLSEATNTRSGGLHLNFAAPELFGFSQDENGSFEDVPARTQMSDVYAFGCLYYEIHYDSIPFAGKQDIQIWTLISRGTLPPRLDEPPLNDGAWSVIQSCWIREASERPRMKDITENMLSMTQFMSLTIEARDQLRTIPAQTLAVLRQELGLLDDRDSSWMTPAERQRLIVASRRRRKSDSAGPAAALQPPNLVQLRGLPQQQPQQQRLKRSNATPEETRIDFSPPRKRHRPPPAQLPIQGISYSPQPQGPPSGPQPGQPGIPMTGQNPSMTMRAPPQMTGVPQGGQLRMGNPMNTGISQPPLGGPRLGVSLHQQGHANQPGRMNQQQQMQWQYRMQNHRLKGPMPPQAMNPTTQGPPSSATPGSSDPTMHPGAPGGPQFNRLPPQNTLLGMIRPLSRAQNGANKDQGGSKGVKQEDPSRSAGRAPNASGAAPATPAPGAPANQGPTPATNGAPNSNIAQSPSSGTPLNPGPIVNQGLALADPLFPPDFIQHISNSLHDFNTRMFPAETDINSERDFGHWFNSDDLDSTERAWLAYLPV